MASDDVSKRLEILEMMVEGLTELPSRVAALDARVESLESHVFQFREEARDEFSAVRREIRDESERTRGD
jgi:hypothetical protein